MALPTVLCIPSAAERRWRDGSVELGCERAGGLVSPARMNIHASSSRHDNSPRGKQVLNNLKRKGQGGLMARLVSSFSPPLPYFPPSVLFC
jgi:hypothetical protein